jgi:hypothetical protein
MEKVKDANEPSRSRLGSNTESNSKAPATIQKGSYTMQGTDASVQAPQNSMKGAQLSKPKTGVC